MGAKGLTWPAALDTDDAKTEKAYKGFPMRLLVIKGGRIAMDVDRAKTPDGKPGLTWDFQAVQDLLRK